MDWNALFTALGNSVPVIIVLGYGWMQAEKRAAAAESKRDDDNKNWADRYAELAHMLSKPANIPEGIDIDKRLN